MLITPKDAYALRLAENASLAEVISAINDLGIGRIVEKGEKLGPAWVLVKRISVEDQLSEAKKLIQA